MSRNLLVLATLFASMTLAACGEKETDDSTADNACNACNACNGDNACNAE